MNMNKRLEWLILLVLAAAGIFAWCRFALPRFQSIDLSVHQTRAVEIARAYLRDKRGIDPGAFRTAVAFSVDEDTDRYLQRTLGPGKAQALIKKLKFDLFFWTVRFFQEKQKEEYKVAISCASGEVIGFNHIIEDTASRPLLEKDGSRALALDFMKITYGFDPSLYTVNAENVKKYDNRQEYGFIWQKKDIEIPWSQSKDDGYAKLITTITVSGHEVLAFAKSQFDIPEGFGRYVDNLKQTGQNLTQVFRLFYLALITIAIVVVVNRKHQVVARQVRPFYIRVGICVFALMVLDVLNSYQTIFFNYPTTQTLANFVVRQVIDNIIGPFFISVAFVLPALAGESLRYEVDPAAKNVSLLSALTSSFGTVNIARQILIGYFAAAMLFGLQAFIFHLGFKYCGVWDELAWLTQASTTVIPSFTALVIGFQAAFSEEVMFRLFAINLFRKYGVPLALAVVLSAALWGFGHTGYLIYPMWFRGIEVTCIGIVMGVFYMRYGLMTVITAHFMIDCMLSNLPYLIKPRADFDFFSALGLALLPLLLCGVARIMNKSEEEIPLKTRFNAQQNFNYHLLKEYCANKSPEALKALRPELERHGWDAAIIQRVFDRE